MSQSSCNILLVEDDPVIRKLNGQVLKLGGYQVTVANNGFDALDKLAEALPDIVVADVMMPGMDGPELCRQARLKYGDSFIVIFLTALDDLATLRRCHEAGADDYLVKEGSPDAMLNLISYWNEFRAGRIAEKDRRPGLGDVIAGAGQ